MLNTATLGMVDAIISSATTLHVIANEGIKKIGGYYRNTTANIGITVATDRR
jgi:hypothetical protein